MDMKLSVFMEVYFEDKQNELKLKELGEHQQMRNTLKL